VAKEVDRRHAVMRDLVNVKGELGLYMLALTFGVVHLATVFRAQPGELHGNGEIGRFGVADGVAHVVRQRTHGEGEFIGVVRIAKEIHHKVARAHVVGQV